MQDTHVRGHIRGPACPDALRVQKGRDHLCETVAEEAEEIMELLGADHDDPSGQLVKELALDVRRVLVGLLIVQVDGALLSNSCMGILRDVFQLGLNCGNN